MKQSFISQRARYKEMYSLSKPQIRKRKMSKILDKRIHPQNQQTKQRINPEQNDEIHSNYANNSDGSTHMNLKEIELYINEKQTQISTFLKYIKKRIELLDTKPDTQLIASMSRKQFIDCIKEIQNVQLIKNNFHTIVKNHKQINLTLESIKNNYNKLYNKWYVEDNSLQFKSKILSKQGDRQYMNENLKRVGAVNQRIQKLIQIVQTIEISRIENSQGRKNLRNEVENRKLFESVQKQRELSLKKNVLPGKRDDSQPKENKLILRGDSASPKKDQPQHQQIEQQNKQLKNQVKELLLSTKNLEAKIKQLQKNKNNQDKQVKPAIQKDIFGRPLDFRENNLNRNDFKRRRNNFKKQEYNSKYLPCEQINKKREQVNIDKKEANKKYNIVSTQSEQIYRNNQITEDGDNHNKVQNFDVDVDNECLNMEKIRQLMLKLDTDQFREQYNPNCRCSRFKRKSNDICSKDVGDEKGEQKDKNQIKQSTPLCNEDNQYTSQKVISFKFFIKKLNQMVRDNKGLSEQITNKDNTISRLKLKLSHINSKISQKNDNYANQNNQNNQNNNFNLIIKDQQVMRDSNTQIKTIEPIITDNKTKGKIEQLNKQTQI